jgi:hypothetical protein
MKSAFLGLSEEVFSSTKVFFQTGKHLFFAFVFIGFILLLPSDLFAQKRDFVTEPEAELIRKYQEIDKRIEVLIKMIDRRLAAAAIPGSEWKAPKNDSSEWGPEPKGSRIDFLSDIRDLLQKAIDDIDDVAARDESPVPGNIAGSKAFNNAVIKLAQAAQRFKGIFEAEQKRSQDTRESGILETCLTMCNDILDAAKNLPKK